jgi:hypothetical protein
MAGPDDPTPTSGPLNWAIARYGIPRPPGLVGQEYLVRFSVDEWSPFVSLGSVCRRRLAAQSLRARDRRRHGRSSEAVNDTDAWIYRLGYNITLIGRIVFIAPSVPAEPPNRPVIYPTNEP